MVHSIKRLLNITRKANGIILKITLGLPDLITSLVQNLI